MTAAPTAVLRIEQLSFSYPRRHVFTHWSAALEPGLTWLRGRNGSGKSTLLKLLAGALPPLTGRLLLDGVDAEAQPLAYRREIHWVGPGGAAFEHLRPPEYFGFLQGLYPRFDAGRIAEAIDGFALAPHLPLRLGALSTGTQRKVLIAAALAAGTRVVLLDEPFNALDPAAAAWLAHTLAARASAPEQAWLVASHAPIDTTQVWTLAES